MPGVRPGGTIQSSKQRMMATRCIVSPEISNEDGRSQDGRSPLPEGAGQTLQQHSSARYQSHTLETISRFILGPGMACVSVDCLHHVSIKLVELWSDCGTIAQERKWITSITGTLRKVCVSRQGWVEILCCCEQACNLARICPSRLC